MPRLPTSRVAYVVIGTSGSAAMTLTPSRPRSVALAMSAGLPAGTMIVSWLQAKATGSPVRPASRSVWTLATSAGAPCSIWVRRAEDESNEYTGASPVSEAYEGAKPSNAPFSDAAAYTASSPVAAIGDPDGVGSTVVGAGAASGTTVQVAIAP